MEKHIDIVTRDAPQERVLDRPVAPASPARAMSPEKAKKLIRKTSAEHEGLFRRLAR
jgi:hypothetical protein